MENPGYPAASQQPHVAICPGSGMGHLTPYLHLAAALSSAPFNCNITFVVVAPILTAAESNQLSLFFSSHPTIHRLDFPLHDSPSGPDPFFSRYVTISRSAHLLVPLLSSLAPLLTAVISDVFFTKGLNTALPTNIPNYTCVTTSARFFSLLTYLPDFLASSPPPATSAHVPGVDPFPGENIPPPFYDRDHIFNKLTVSIAQHLHLSKGILLNTFDSFEPETLSALRTCSVVPDLPPVITFGPHRQISKINERDEVLSWLDEQPEKSVVYVSFGNRTALSEAQMRELGLGLEKSGCRFLWVVKSTMVDKEEKGELGDLLGEGLLEKLGGKGKVVSKWVKQEVVLGHRAVGWFVSHCGWNSVMEAAVAGVAVLAWPMHGDQRENARVVEKAGLGVWERGWGSTAVVGAAEIAEKVKAVMGDVELSRSAERVGKEANRACEDGGSSTANLMSFVESLKIHKNSIQ